MATQKSHSAEKVRLRTYKLAVDAPRLQLDELISPSMAINHLFTSDPRPPAKQNGMPPIVRTLSPPTGSQYSANHDTPRRQSSHDRTRHAASPPISEADTSILSFDTTSNSNTPTSEANPWSSAVGRATTGGKSGRVIERLMNDNDSLRREKKLAVVKLEEEVKRGESARAALESLQVSNDNLRSMHESDTTLLVKRDRRIQQLRDDLEGERIRRERAERETRETRREREDTIDRLKRETANEKEQRSRATSQYEMLSKSWKSLEDRHLQQTETLRRDLEQVRIAINSDKQKLGQMEIIMEQMAKEADKTKRTKEKLSSDFEVYKLEQEASIRGMRESAEHNEAAHDDAQNKMHAMLAQMKYIVNIKRHVRDTA